MVKLALDRQSIACWCRRQSSPPPRALRSSVYVRRLKVGRVRKGAHGSDFRGSRNGTFAVVQSLSYRLVKKGFSGCADTLHERTEIPVEDIRLTSARGQSPFRRSVSSSVGVF
jgi:hypothetical protein